MANVLDLRRRILSTGLVLCGALFPSLAVAQAPAVSMSRSPDGNTQTFLAGEFTMPQGASQLFYDVDNDTFACNLIRVVKEGETIGVVASSAEKYSTETVSMTSDGKRRQYPILALLSASSGNMRAFLPAVLTAKKMIKAGTAVRTSEDKEKNAFVIQSTRDIAAGEKIGVLFVNGPAILSIDADKTGDQALGPWFTAFESTVKPEQRRDTLETWRKEMSHLK